MTNGPPNRFEFDALQHRLDRIDERGTSGAASFQVRLEAVEAELASRSASRRWMIGIAVTAAGVMSGIATFVAVFIFHAH